MNHQGAYINTGSKLLSLSGPFQPQTLTSEHPQTQQQQPVFRDTELNQRAPKMKQNIAMLLVSIALLVSMMASSSTAEAAPFGDLEVSIEGIPITNPYNAEC